MRLLVCLAALALAACQFVPGSDANKIKEAQAEVAKSLVDPASAAFRNVTLRDNGIVCGEVAGNDLTGLQSDFVKFIFENPTGKMILRDPDPQSWKDVKEVRETCRRMAEIDWTGGTCEAAAKIKMRYNADGRFKKAWKTSCGSSPI